MRFDRMKVIDLEWAGDHDALRAGFYVTLECGHRHWRPTNILAMHGIAKSLKEHGAVCRQGCRPVDSGTESDDPV